MNIRDLILEAYVEVLKENDVLKTSSQEILGKFPTLKQALVSLLTSQFNDFVDEVKWVAPKPSTFAIVLNNGQTFHLKWQGKTFEAEIQGKRYMLNSTRDFQQALDRLNELLKYSTPSLGGEEDLEGEPSDLFGAETSGADSSPIPPPPEEGGEIEFEEPGEEPI